MGILLSIIIPMYNTNDYLDDLLDVLDKQINDQVEVLVIDDGSVIPYISKYEWANVIHLNKNSGVAGKPRNIGLDIATGEYIAFIDSDDLVSNDYIQKIMQKINKKPDIIYLSWKSIKQEIIMNPKPPRWNCAVWCRVYKQEIIGNIRFNETLVRAEDWVFNHKLKPRTIKSIKTPIYFYNWCRTGSITTGE